MSEEHKLRNLQIPVHIYGAVASTGGEPDTVQRKRILSLFHQQKALLQHANQELLLKVKTPRSGGYVVRKNLEKEVGRLRFCVRAYRAPLLNQRRIPAEIWARIFHHFVLTDAPRLSFRRGRKTIVFIGPVYLLAAVCNLWRSIVMISPCVWSNMSIQAVGIDGGEEQEQMGEERWYCEAVNNAALDRIRLALDNVGTHPWSLHFNSEATYRYSGIRRIYRDPTPQLSLLPIIMEHPAFAFLTHLRLMKALDLPKAIQTLCFPAARSVVIHGRSYGPHTTLTPGCDIPRLPAVTRAVICGNGAPTQIPWANLTHLQLATITTQLCGVILNLCTSLERGWFDNSTPLNAASTLRSISTPAKELVFLSYSPFDDVSVTAPNLVDLRLFIFKASERHVSWDGIQDSSPMFPSLRRLNVTKSATRSSQVQNELVPLLQNCPLLTDLLVNIWHEDRALLECLTPSGHASAPPLVAQLNHLTIFCRPPFAGDPPFPEDAMWTLIQSRTHPTEVLDGASAQPPPNVRFKMPSGQSFGTAVGHEFEYEHELLSVHVRVTDSANAAEYVAWPCGLTHGSMHWDEGLGDLMDKNPLWSFGRWSEML